MKSIRKPCRLEAGVTLVETMVAVGVTVAAIAGLSASVQQASRIARAGKAAASGSQLVEERIESFRQTSTWSNVTTTAGISLVASAPTAIAANFPNVTETFQVQAYPNGSQLVVTRSPNGSFTSNGPDLSTSRCVKFTVIATWAGLGGSSNSMEFSTVMTKGGL